MDEKLITSETVGFSKARSLEARQPRIEGVLCQIGAHINPEMD